MSEGMRRDTPRREGGEARGAYHFFRQSIIFRVEKMLTYTYIHSLLRTHKCIPAPMSTSERPKSLNS
jgi:hypothetical protein